MLNIPLAQLLTASIIAAILGISGYMVAPAIITPAATMTLTPAHGVVQIDDTFIVTLFTTANTPVNVFQGKLTFNKDVVTVEKIDYNTSVADLWAEEPWYSNGDGTLNFVGGTTKPGGFQGEGALITITFRAKQRGEAHIAMKEIKILKHDGLGTLIETATPIDSIFTVNNEGIENEIVYKSQETPIELNVITKQQSTDLNGDGKNTMVDVSIFMTDVVSQNQRSDFNQDGKVTLKDLSILTRK